MTNLLAGVCTCGTTRTRYQHCGNCDTQQPDSFPSDCTCPVYNLPADVLCSAHLDGGRNIKHRASKYPA